MAEKFYSFEKTMLELGKTEDELKKIVSEGEIRAFRADNSMKFKKEDVKRYLQLASMGQSPLTSDELSGDDSHDADYTNDRSFLSESSETVFVEPSREGTSESNTDDEDPVAVPPPSKEDPNGAEARILNFGEEVKRINRKLRRFNRKLRRCMIIFGAFLSIMVISLLVAIFWERLRPYLEQLFR